MTPKEILINASKVHADIELKPRSSSIFLRILDFFFRSLRQRWMSIGQVIYHPNDFNLPLDKTNPTLSRILVHEIAHMNQAFFGLDCPVIDAGSYEEVGGLLEAGRLKRRGFFDRLFGHYLPYLFWRFPLFLAFYRAEAELGAVQAEVLYLSRNEPLLNQGVLPEVARAIFAAWEGYLSDSSYFWALTKTEARRRKEAAVEEVLSYFERKETP